MCGICGYIRYEKPIDDKAPIIEKMCDLLKHRGPDDSGIFMRDNVALGHRRLSIIDLSSGHQPMSDEQGKIWIAFNGEIYNFQDIRRDLEQKGAPFKTHSDTEVIVQGYKMYGTDIVHKLNGMFSFAIWDDDRKRMFVARDRLGKKPLYYYAGSDRFLFSSELKSIVVDPEVPRTISPEAVDKFFSYSYIPAPLTIYEGIFKLRPGHLLVWENRAIRVEQYWDVHYRGEADHSEGEVGYIDRLYELLKAAVKRRLISDVPLGAFLSGGIDSSVVVGLMAELSDQPVKTFSIGFRNQNYSELPDARLVAERFATDHHEYIVEPENIIELLPKLIRHFDEPFADSSAIPTFQVSRLARRDVTVILSGDGGDELFAGYKSYKREEEFQKYKKIPKFIRENMIGPAARMLPIQARGKYFLDTISRLDADPPQALFPPIKGYLYSDEFLELTDKVEPPESIADYWQKVPEQFALSKLQYMDTKIYLPDDIMVKVDRMSMANSLETRAPLLDYTVVEFAATIPENLQMKNGTGKYILKKLAERLLPSEILTKKKQGFAIPKNEWFRSELKDYAVDMLTSQRFKDRGYFNPKHIEFIIKEHGKGVRDYSLWIWCLLNFELWYQIYIDTDTRWI